MYYLGIDVGSISTDLVLTEETGQIVEQLYLKTGGRPIDAIRQGLNTLGKTYAAEAIAGVGTTGSGRNLAAALVGADVQKNEITTHGVAAAKVDPEIRTVIEIGGQDSKLILLQDGYVCDFAMNTVCAAGTGSFLDRQADRMGISIAALGELACKGKNPTPIAGRCAVFAESDLIHRQQMGIPQENLLAGLCNALVKSYLANVAQGKKLHPKVCFQGGVAANAGIKKAFMSILKTEVIVPKAHKVMGAYGAALLAQERDCGRPTAFKGFSVGEMDVTTDQFLCTDCPNNCRVVQLWGDGRSRGCFGDKCGKHQKQGRLSS